MTYLLALDQGTTSSRAILFDGQAQLVGVAQQAFTQHFPQPGWVEHDAMDIWHSQLGAMRSVLQQQGVSASEVTALGITNQRETTLLWDRATGQPLSRAIVWQDRRTAAACDALHASGQAARIQRDTGLVVDAYFSATKLQWLLDHIPGARQRAERGELAFGTVDSWLIWQLSAGPRMDANTALHVTDASNASRTMLFNLHTLQWDDWLLRQFDIPAAVLPQVVPSCGVLGEVHPDWLGASIPIAGVAGDQQAATFGQGCWSPGMAKNTYGTGCFMLMNTGTTAVPSQHRLLATVGWQGPPGQARRTAYCLEGSVFMAGATVQWLRDGLGIIGSAHEVEALAASVPDSGDVFLVPAFAGLGTPHWDGHARAALLGMTRGTTRAHIARAALEAIALQVADVFEAMRADSGIALRELRVDGGACRNDLLMQLQADLLGVPVLRPQMHETTALGAALLAGLATGVWRSGEEPVALHAIERRFEPRLSDAWRKARRERWGEAVQRALRWAPKDAV